MSGAATLKATTSQTVGPFFAPALLRDPLNVMVSDTTAGERVRIEGRVIDGDGQPVSDAMIEVWQANSHGRYNHPLDRRDLPLDEAFTGFGRAGSDDAGRFWFETIKPGPVPFDGTTMQAPHLSVTVMSRGMLNHAVTRLYFADDPANESDPVLGQVPASRRTTLLAQRDDADGSVVYRFDIVLQGRGETVFFNV